MSLFAERITTAETSQLLRCSAEAPADLLTSCDGNKPYRADPTESGRVSMAVFHGGNGADPHHPKSVDGKHAHC
ncbi:MAG: hypothetical protein EBU26_12820 [Verrucomicrobia bacterium]|nr:hypothetical protein [Verrucomicrobiota bacterium]